MKQILTLALLSAGLLGAVAAQEDKIRKALPENFVNIPTIELVTGSEFPGLFEVRMADSSVIYTDANGTYILQGEIIRSKDKVNMTRERSEKLLKGEYKDLDVKDAIKVVTGNGKRKFAVFADPNCGFCKKFEQELVGFKDAPMYVYLIPILGPSSVDKAKQIWCAKDQAAAWTDWMVKGTAPADAICDTSAIDRNQAWARKSKVTGTPAIFFPGGKRVGGYMPMDQLEARLAESKQ